MKKISIDDFGIEKNDWGYYFTANIDFLGQNSELLLNYDTEDEVSEIPIIILTAKDQILNKVELLDMGADDYLTKPFEIEELFARMRVALRNKKNFENKNFIVYGSLKLDTKGKKLYKNDDEIYLTKKEYNLFYLLLVNKEIVVSREKILEEVWGFDYGGEEKIVDVYINSLRKKIDEGNEKYIHTARGFGYILKRE